MENFLYKFKSMDLLQFATLSDQYDAEKIKGHIEMRYWFDLQARTIFCQSSFLLSSIDDETPLLKAALQSGFEIKEESLAGITTGGQIVFPANILALFASLTYSSLRGVVFAKAENTPFKGIILPVQDMQLQIKNPYVFTCPARADIRAED